MEAVEEWKKSKREEKRRSLGAKMKDAAENYKKSKKRSSES